MTSASTPPSPSETVSRSARAPATLVALHIRGRSSPLAWLFAPAPAARLATLRILVGVYATAWACVRLPAHLAHADQVAARWRPVGVLAPLEAPPADLAVLPLLVLAWPPAADVLAVGRPRAAPGPAADGRYGWPVRLAAVVVVLAYVIAGVAKLRIGGLDWLDGDALRNWGGHDKLREA